MHGNWLYFTNLFALYYLNKWTLHLWTRMIQRVSVIKACIGQPWIHMINEENFFFCLYMYRPHYITTQSNMHSNTFFLNPRKCVTTKTNEFTAIYIVHLKSFSSFTTCNIWKNFEKHRSYMTNRDKQKQNKLWSN